MFDRGGTQDSIEVANPAVEMVGRNEIHQVEGDLDAHWDLYEGHDLGGERG
jgi:hypothetical protein